MFKIRQDFILLYCKRRLKEREWLIDTTQLQYDYLVLSSVVLRFTKRLYPRSIIINPTLFFQLFHLKPDVIVTYAYSIPTLIAFIYAKLFRKKLVSWTTLTPHVDRNTGTLQRLMRRLIIDEASSYIAASYDGMEFFEEYGASKDNVYIVPQPIAEQFSQVVHDKTPESKVILFVGFLNERKGVMHLLEAFRTVHESLASVRLVMVGSGDKEAEIKAYIHDNNLDRVVDLVGFVQHSELPQYYAKASVFVLPTLEDTFGVVIAEAAACSLPIITTPYAGATSLYVNDGSNGYIVEPTDHKALADAMLKVLDNPDIAPMRRASKDISANYTVELSAYNFGLAIDAAQQQ